MAAGLFLSTEIPARTIYVDQRTGDDRWNGATETPAQGGGPLKTIQQAVHLSVPGDIIFLVPGSGAYRDEVRIEKSGTSEAPITLEGNDNTIDLGVDTAQGPWKAADGAWILESPTIPQDVPRLDYRALAFYKGKPVFMKTKKTANPNIATVFLTDDRHLGFRFSENLSPPFPGLVVPRSPAINGIAIKNASYWRIKDLNVIGAGNDGFNLHGHAKGIVIENCSALFCGDEGISSHETIEAEVTDFLSAFNNSSVVDIGQSVTSYTRCISAFNGRAGFVMPEERGSHTFTNCLSAANYRQEDAKDLPPSTTKVENLTSLPKSEDVLEKIRAWNPEHPQMKRLLDTAGALRRDQADWQP